MLKRAVILYGSPKTNSNTEKLTKQLMDIWSNDYEFFLFDSYKESIKPCYDCGLCRKENVCRFSDLEDLFVKIEESDLIILASPIYNMGFPAPLKAVLDRFQFYYNLRFRKKNILCKEKKAIIVLVQGSKNRAYSDFLIKNLKEILKSINTKIEKSFVLLGTDFKDHNIEEVYNEMKELK